MTGTLLRFLMPFPMRGYVHVTRLELEDMKRRAEKQNQLLLLYTRIKRHREMIGPPADVDDFLADLSAVYYRNAVRCMRQEVVEQKTRSLLSAEGIPSVLMRGNAIARDIYCDQYCRVSSDVDILIKEEDLFRADYVLSQNGYIRDDGLPLKFWVNRIHHAVYHYPGANDFLELHWNFCIPSFFRLSSADIWADTVRVEKNSYALSPTMNVIQLLLHHYMHAFREPRILTDIIWALHKYEDSIDWKRLGEEIKRIGLLKTAMITLGQISSICGELAESEASLSLFRKTVEGLGRRTPRFLNSFFRMAPEKEHAFQDPRDKLVSRLALDGAGTICHSFLKSLLPMPEDIRQLYADRRRWMLPLNYSRFIAWRLREWKG